MTMMNYFPDNNDEMIDLPTSINQADDTQSSMPSHQSDPKIRPKVQIENNMQVQLESTSVAKESSRPRRGARKQNDNHDQITLQNSKR